MWMRAMAAVAAGLVGVSGAMGAGVLVQSTFDSGDEGWRLGEMWAGQGLSTPVYQAAGGNPGGFIRTPDVWGWNAFVAPAKFLGNQLGAYGGLLRVDQRVASSDGVNYPMVVLSDGTLNLQFRTAPPPNGAWRSHEIGLLASAGWEVANGSGNPGPAATEDQLRQVLSGLAWMTLEGDWQSGADQIDMDNVALVGRSTVPGDTNGDGLVTRDDYARIDRGFAMQLTGWWNGDFDENGVINAADYAIINAAFGQQQNGGTAGLLAAVPEPGTAVLAGWAVGAAVVGRGRRRGRAV